MRGHRYIDDILAEITRFHAANGAHRITATTDMTNLPMAAAFERAGYRNYETGLVLSGPRRPRSIGAPPRENSAQRAADGQNPGEMTIRSVSCR
jgi:hypothetical protein